MTGGEDRNVDTETRCIALSEGDRGGSADVCGKRFPTRVTPKRKNHVFLKPLMRPIQTGRILFYRSCKK